MAPPGRHWQERAIIAALLAACVVLAFLQYRWIGELSQAESVRLFASASGRLQQLTRAFDTELRQSVMEFVPSGDEFRGLGPRRANEERFNHARASLERPLFRRVAAAVPDNAGVLHYWEGGVAGPWPDQREWRALRSRLEGMLRGDSPRGQIVDPGSALIEVPVFGQDNEREWIMLELDTDYAARIWLPELVRTYLNPEGEGAFQVSVVWGADPARAVYGTASAKADAEATLFPIRFLNRGGRPTDSRWLVRVTHEAGSVPAAVTSVRRRNLAAAFVLLALIVAAAAALLRNTRQARRLADAQYQFFAGISHELRTPLTIIQGAGHNLLSGVVRDDVQRASYAGAIVKQSSQLAEMIDQLLSYGAARQAPAMDSTARLDVVVSDAVESAAFELEQNQRSVDIDMPADLPAVRGDQATLRRVLGNLILNGVRHGGGEVTVSAARAGDFVEIRVADGGQGIPASELKRVFEPFFRGEQARTGRTRGTGLGLSLVREAVERLGGTVTAESQPGKGTVFTVRLRIAA